MRLKNKNSTKQKYFCINIQPIHLIFADVNQLHTEHRTPEQLALQCDSYNKFEKSFFE